jgi:hypothetical protein
VQRLSRQVLASLLCLTLSACIEVTTFASLGASGTVVDATTRKPLQGATVAVAGHPGLFTQTDALGRFSLESTTQKAHVFLLGPYHSLPPISTVVVSAPGYAARELDVSDAGVIHVRLAPVH